MAVSLDTSQGEVEFIHNVVSVARLIVFKSGSAYGLRVVNKLREIVPEVHPPPLQELAFELEAATSAVQV